MFEATIANTQGRASPTQEDVVVTMLVLFIAVTEPAVERKFIRGAAVAHENAAVAAMVAPHSHPKTDFANCAGEACVNAAGNASSTYPPTCQSHGVWKGGGGGT